MKQSFRLLLVLPALILIGCTSPLEPNQDSGEHPKPPPPDGTALIVEQVGPSFLV